ncbi:fibronectin type III domain-containing protein, partial [Luminiphilus sp.]|nr:fibronectin type III domain-containing protein [Luminiphilus sp.]
TAGTFTVKTAVGPGGSLDPAGPQQVASGTTLDFTVNENDDNVIDSITGCGGSLNGKTYRTAPITEDCTVTVQFRQYRWRETAASKTVSFNSLPEGENFSCSSVASNVAGDSSASNVVSFKTQAPKAPSSPTIIDFDYADGEIKVRVTADDGGSPITSYTATCTDGTNTFTGTSTSSPITVSGLTNDVAYTCTVTATNSVGTSSASAATDPITPEKTSTGLPIWLLYQATQ